MPEIHLSTGITTYYEEKGNGEPLILLSGAGADHTAWCLQVPQFCKEFRVVTPDNRGAGRAQGADKLADFSISLCAADVIALMDALKIKQAHIMGQSLGSVIAQEIATTHPHRILSLVLLVTWGKSDMRIKQICKVMKFLLKKYQLEKYFKYTYSLAFSTALLEARPYFIDTYFRESVTDYSHPPGKKGLLGQWHAIYHHDLLKKLQIIKAPSLICAGEADVLIPAVYGAAVASKISGAQYHLFRGKLASHLLHIEMAPAFNSLSLEFLRSHRQ